jgi:cytochrome c biogenesis protein CcmG, thiol:disulfide interchange protein DsbE
MSDPNARPLSPRFSLATRFVVFAPLAVFAAVAVLFFVRLQGGDASRIPSVLINKPVPTFTLPALEGLAGVPGFSDATLKSGTVSLVNVFASWCGPCHQEHPVLLQLANDKELAKNGFRVIGLAYKDDPEDARRFLGTAGNPFAAIGNDGSGRTAIDWGVYGVPESFVVRGDGTIAFKYVGPLTEEALAQVLLPEINKAMHYP